MEGKELEPVESSELPLTSRESQPPLVVDLPDGQKLVVGNLDPGTVIEVATWRGTGRPDSRTNRFMLGVSSNEDEGIPAKRALPKPVEISNLSQPSEQVLIDTQAALNGYGELGQQISHQIPESISSTLQTNNAQVATGVIYANVNPQTNQRAVSKIEDKPSWFYKHRSKVFIGASIAGIISLCVAMLGPVGLRFSHPVSGAGSALGSANSSLVVVKQIQNYSIGDSVVSDLISPKPSPVVAIIAQINDRAILLSTETGYVQIRPELLHGKVVAVLPFIGQIANLFNR